MRCVCLLLNNCSWFIESNILRITNQGPVFYIRTNKGAPQYKVVTIDITTEGEPTEFIPQSDAFLSSMMCTNKGYFVLVYKRDVCPRSLCRTHKFSDTLHLLSQVKDEIYLYSPEGKKLERLAEDFVGTALVSGRKKQSWFFVSMSGFTSPGTIARYSFDNPPEQRWSIYRQAKLNGLQPSEFEARQVGIIFYNAHRVCIDFASGLVQE